MPEQPGTEPGSLPRCGGNPGSVPGWRNESLSGCDFSGCDFSELARRTRIASAAARRVTEGGIGTATGMSSPSESIARATVFNTSWGAWTSPPPLPMNDISMKPLSSAKAISASVSEISNGTPIVSGISMIVVITVWWMSMCVA